MTTPASTSTADAPKMMFTGLAITGTIYILVGIIAVVLVPLDQLSEGSTPLLGLGLVTFVTGVPSLSGTTSLLLLAVFTVVNVAVLVLRRDPVEHRHFRAPTFVPVLGALVCLYLVSPLVDRDVARYKTAGILLGIGVVLWVVTAIHRHSGDSNRARFDHPEHLA